MPSTSGWYARNADKILARLRERYAAEHPVPSRRGGPRGPRRSREDALKAKAEQMRDRLEKRRAKALAPKKADDREHVRALGRARQARVRAKRRAAAA
jgi:hypothetical protein